MHIISQKALKVFARRHPDSQAALDAWYQLVDTNHFESLVALRKLFPHADKVGRLIVFNIGGNKYRLIASIHFNRQKVFVRYILTHAEYDRGDWKE
jgi:mRNA interferase HigB